MAPVPARPWSAGGRRGGGGFCGYGDWRPTTGHGHRSLPPSIHRQACQIDELMIVIPSDPGPHWLRPRALDPLVSSRRGSHHSKSFGARHQRKEREEKTAKSFQGLSSETEREKSAIERVFLPALLRQGFCIHSREERRERERDSARGAVVAGH